MTIAIGYLCRDGLILGADSQSGISGSLKWPTQKILPIDVGGIHEGMAVNAAALAVAGAGNTHYLHEMQEISARLIDPSDTAMEIETKLRERYREFYTETVLPFAGTGGAPELWMMFGVQKDNSVSLYTTEQLSFRENRAYAAVGSGEFVARALIESTFPMYPPISVAKLLMVHALQHVRDRVDGVGGNSVIIAISQNKCEFVNRQFIREAEREFEKYRSAQVGLIQYVTGYLAEDEIGRVSGEASELRKALADITARG
ncbi:MAG TPA: hypothetical protein VGM43_13670 [Bryobacteraceae bacterium]|jgi:20S proteasome alpha/beta subunit